VSKSPDASPRRGHILSVAARLLVHYGPRKTTVADIARAAGVGVGTVYLEFRNKDAIVAALSRDRYTRVGAAMREAARGASTPADAVRAALDARTRALLAHACDGEHAGELLHRCCPAVEPVRQAYAEAERAFLAELLGGDAARAAAVQRAYATFTPPTLFEQPEDAVWPALEQLHALVAEGLRPRG
jgi:AcrR family transcriptional regulator